MAVEHVKGVAITNRDATPKVRNTTGEGGVGKVLQINDYVTVPASASVDSTFQLVRLPSNAKVKSIIFESEAMGAGKFDIGAYYATGGESAGASALLAAAAIDQDFFATAIDCASAVTPTEVSNESGTNTLDKRNYPLWKMLGLASDPGGYIDICATVVTTAVTTGAAKLGVRVSFVE